MPRTGGPVTAGARRALRCDSAASDAEASSAATTADAGREGPVPRHVAGACATAGTGELQTPCSSEDVAGRDPWADAEEDEEEIDQVLLALEQEMTREVPDLLETMNRASGDVNVFEVQLSDAQERYRRLLDQWSRNYEQLRAHYGSSIDKARPYFDALQSLNAAKREVQGAAREFSAAASQHTQAKGELRAIEEQLAYGAHKVALDRDQQDGLSRATVRVLRCQQERDQREQDYARVLREYQVAEEAAEAWRAQIGESAIRRALPCFKQLQQHQLTLAAEQTRINALSEKAKSAKTAYNHSMRELDRISVAVHVARKSHAESVAASHAESVAAGLSNCVGDAPPEGGGEGICADARPVVSPPAAEAPPEETPCQDASETAKSGEAGVVA